MTKLHRGSARIKPASPHVKKLAAKTRAGNMQVMVNFSRQFAGAVNGVVAYESRAMAEKALEAVEQGINVALKNMVAILKKEYPNNWNHSTYFGVNDTASRLMSASKGLSFSNDWGRSLSRRWLTRKRNALFQSGQRLPAGGAPFHGYGYFGLRANSNPSSIKTPLKVWVDQLNMTEDVRNLYKLMGVAKLQITGDLATKKGYQQTNKGFVNSKGRKVAMKEAMKRSRPHQVEGHGLVIRVNEKQGMTAYVKGRRVSLLELNHAGLIGSKLQLVALSNMFQGQTGAPKNRGFKFIEHAERFNGGRNDIFGRNAGMKLHFSAKRARDPFGNLLNLIIEEIMPIQIQQQMVKRKVIK